MEQKLPQALIDFDRLPDGAYVRVNVVAQLLGCSIPTIWRKSRSGTFPKPLKFSTHVTSWNVGDIREVLKDIRANSSK
ncbi:MAG: AlpA family phage regulatory protein [Nitrosomonas sp.]|mgnify:CR=1 FL=1|nr:AlpA family phage regulatory protein [Nitrosomonas sp.]MBK7363780.1 AlpA family phage regulatory protein [Nitrosomonas sp.]